MYEEGQGVARDYSEAARWYRQAAEQGIAVAQTALATLYTKGSGVAQDLPEAVRWYRKAAEQGFAPALHELGALYAEGRGVAQDYVAAHVWLDLAAFRARSPLREQYSAERDGVAGKLTPEQVGEAKRRALELRAKWAR